MSWHADRQPDGFVRLWHGDSLARAVKNSQLLLTVLHSGWNSMQLDTYCVHCLRLVHSSIGSPMSSSG